MYIYAFFHILLLLCIRMYIDDYRCMYVYMNLLYIIYILYYHNYMCMQTYVYIYIYVEISISRHMYMQIYVYTYVHRCMYKIGQIERYYILHDCICKQYLDGWHNHGINGNASRDFDDSQVALRNVISLENPYLRRSGSKHSMIQNLMFHGI